MNKIYKYTLVIALFAVCAFDKVTAQVPSYIPKDSLVGWWPFNGNANDESGNGNNGDTFNLISTTDINNNLKSAYLFNGKSSFVSIPKSKKNGLTSNWTISAWINTSGFNGESQYQTLISKRNDAGMWAYSLSLSYVGNEAENEHLVSGRRDKNLTIDLKYSKGKIVKNKWIHIVATCKKDTIFYYIDGKKSGGGQVFNINVPDQDVDISIGRICACGSTHPEWFFGKMDDLGIWNRTLDSSEIFKIYKSKNCSLTIQKHPQDKGCFGGNAYFIIKTTDTTAKYKWQTNQGTGWAEISNAGQYSGVTTDSLVVKNVTTSNDGQLFRCIVNGDCGKDTTREAKLSLWGANIKNVHKQKVSIYPNPVKNTLNVAGLSNFYYEIHNLTGQTLFYGFSKEQINTEILQSGVYILEINNQKIKFIKE